MEELSPDALMPGAKASASTIHSMKAQAMARRRVVFEGPPEETAKKLMEALAAQGVLPR
jgi:electron transfer flavoprotein alpha/beta subunit